MQSRKTAKKPRQKSDEAVVASETSPVAELKAPPLKTESIVAKKPTETIVAKKATRSRKPSAKTVAASAPVSASTSEQVTPAETAVPVPSGARQEPTPQRAMTASAGAAFGAVESPISDPVGPLTGQAPTGATFSTAANAPTSAPSVSPEEIARLAYSYWVARGYTHGSHDEDWIRAEQELTGRK